MRKSKLFQFIIIKSMADFYKIIPKIAFSLEFRKEIIHPKFSKFLNFQNFFFKSLFPLIFIINFF